MTIETIILDCLKKHIKGLSKDNEEFLKGISEYAQDNNMNSLLKENSPLEITEFLVSAFLDPFFKMPSKMVNTYFESYSLVKEFKILSNSIFELAKNKMQSHDVSLSENLEKRVIDCISEIYSKKELESIFAAEVSDVILEIDYIRGRTDKYSVRLSRTVR